MSRVPALEELSFAAQALAYEFRDRTASGEADEFLRTDENWSLEDRAMVADFFERHQLADELRAHIGATS